MHFDHQFGIFITSAQEAMLSQGQNPMINLNGGHRAMVNFSKVKGHGQLIHDQNPCNDQSWRRSWAYS